MAKKYLILILSLFFISCSNFQSYFVIFMGNLNYSRNEFEEANYFYLTLKNPKYQNYVNYNLGNVYFYLGEVENSYFIWKSILDSNDVLTKELEYRVNLNLGFLKFEQGEYNDSFNYYKKALYINPKSLSAKKNMENVINKLNSITDSYSKIEKQINKNRELSFSSKKILEKVKRREDFKWQLEQTDKSTLQRDW